MTTSGGRLWDTIKSSWNIKRHDKKQSTWIYCSCGNEMVKDAALSFVRDVYVNERNVVHYKCSQCGKDSYFDFDFPAPVKLPINNDDNIIENYRNLYISK